MANGDGPAEMVLNGMQAEVVEAKVEPRQAWDLEGLGSFRLAVLAD